MIFIVNLWFIYFTNTTTDNFELSTQTWSLPPHPTADTDQYGSLVGVFSKGVFSNDVFSDGVFSNKIYNWMVIPILYSATNKHGNSNIKSQPVIIFNWFGYTFNGRNISVCNELGKIKIKIIYLSITSLRNSTMLHT